MKRLPLGIQTFSKLILDNHYYVDKTEFVYRMANIGTYFFLSRPRRFGKSSFLDTLKEAYEGNETLFKGIFYFNQRSLGIQCENQNSSNCFDVNSIELETLLFQTGYLTIEETKKGRLYDLLYDGDVAKLKDLFHAFFASIPYNWYTNNNIASYDSGYIGSGTVKEIYLIGVEFNKTDRNITRYDWERIL